MKAISFFQYILLRLSRFSLLLTFLTVLLLEVSGRACGKGATVVTGSVTDAATKQSMPGVSVSFTGTTTGTSTDNNGHFTLSGNGNFNRVTITFIGYKPVTRDIVAGKEQIINVVIAEDPHLLKEVVINSGKKIKYRNKGNPAVELIRKVIAHKKQNRMENN